MAHTSHEMVTPEALTTLVQRLREFGGQLGHEERAVMDLLMASAPPLKRPVTEEDVATFRSDGVVLIRGVAPEWVDVVRAATQRLLDEPSPFLIQRASEPGGARSMRDDRAWQREPALEAYVRWSPGASLARALLGDEGDLVLTGVSVFGKEPGVGLGSPWHHDRPRPPVPEDRICNLWMALDDGTPDSGTLQVIRGSHRWDQTRLARVYRPGGVDSRSAACIPGLALADGEVVDVASFSVAAGDMVCLDGRAVHGAAGNSSPRPFRAVTTFWWAGDSAWIRGAMVDDQGGPGGRSTP
jgi:hypothetical protein